MATPSPLEVLRGHDSDVQALEFDDRGHVLLSGDAQGELRIWDLDAMRPTLVARLHALSPGIIGLRVFTDWRGRRALAAQSRGGMTVVYQLDVQLHPQGDPLLVFSREAFSFCKLALLQRTDDAGRPQAQQQPPSSSRQQQQQPDQPACSGSAHLQHHRTLLAIPGDDGKAVDVCCADCGSQLLRVGQAGAGRELGMCMALSLYRLPRSETGSTASVSGPADPSVAPGSTTAAAAATSSSTGPYLAAGYEDGSLAIWDLAALARQGSGALNAQPLAIERLHEETLVSMDVDPDGCGGVSGGAGDSLAVFAIDYGARSISVARRLPLRKPGVNAVAVRRDGKLVAAAGWDGRARAWKRGSGRPLAVLKYHTAAVSALRFSPDSRLLGTSSADGAVAVWSLYPAE